jgi:hypothetical protein
LFTFNHVADARLRLVDNTGAAIAFEHLNRHRAKFRKWHLSAWPTLPFRLNMTLPTADRYQRGKDHDPKDENLSLGCVDKLFLPTHSVFSTQVEATKRLRSRVIGKLGLMPVAGLLHRNQTPCPTRRHYPVMCTGRPSPSRPRADSSRTTQNWSTTGPRLIPLENSPRRLLGPFRGGKAHTCQSSKLPLFGQSRARLSPRFKQLRSAKVFPLRGSEFPSDTFFTAG